MLDFFTIFSKGGILLWCFKGTGLLPSEWEAFTHSVNDFIKAVLLQEKSGNKNIYEPVRSTAALKYKLDNEFELVFVAAYQKMLPLLYLDKLLDEIQLRFRDRFSKIFKEQHFFFSSNNFSEFDSEFLMILNKVESDFSVSNKKEKMRSFQESTKSQKSIRSMIESTPNDNKENKKKYSEEQQRQKFSTNNNNKEEVLKEKPNAELDEETRLANLKAMQDKLKAKMASSGPAQYKAKSPKAQSSENKKGGKKKSTTWDPFVFGGRGATGAEAEALERGPKTSADNEENNDDDRQMTQFVPDLSVVGFSSEIRELKEESSEDEEEIELLSDQKKSGGAGRGIWAALSTLVGNKTLTADDIEPVISKMQDHLISKNVASDVALKLCASIAAKLEGKVMGTFQSVHHTVKDTLTESLMKLLTPKRRIDIIRDVVDAKANNRPYVMVFCGVNGVGKSTNLAKICFWLIENKCRVLIAACDTFRAGAVEQLRTHTRRLNSLHPPVNGKPMVELYEKGYGKDAAGIAMEAVNHARAMKIDVVLVDTAGRMQDNEPLMRALSKLISVNAPDLVLFVGEALVGNEAVDQLVKFNAALADHSSNENPHLIDGIVLTKFDTIDDKVGSSISMTYITGQPIVFIGTGQTYTDLKSLNAKAVVQALMK